MSVAHFYFSIASTQVWLEAIIAVYGNVLVEISVSFTKEDISQVRCKDLWHDW